MNENIFIQVKCYMKSKFYSFNESWLKECVQYCAETHPKLSVEGIQSFAKEQWLLSNLREINNQNVSLPKNLAQQKKTTLHGKFILQIEKMYDISTSKYKQLEKIRNVDVVNLQTTKDTESEFWEPKGERMYQLFLTDGVQEIQAMEFKPIRFFNEPLLPGYKLMIIGPVTCRRGMIMLEEKHIFGLGGEIEDLLIPNSLENILARFLNLKENPDPYNDTKRKEESESSDLGAEFEEYLNDLEKLAQDQETKENGRPSLNLNSSVLPLESSSKLNLQQTLTKQNVDELLSDVELEALLNDPDIVDEFPSVKSVPNLVNLEKLGQKNCFKVPAQPYLKVTQERKLIAENSNQISRSAKNSQFQDDSFSFDNRNGELSGSWNNFKEVNSNYYKIPLKTTQKVEIGTRVSKPETWEILEVKDDDLILDDEDLIVFDSWDNPKANSCNFLKLPVEKSGTVQLSTSSKNNLGMGNSSNGKSFEPKKFSGPSQAYKTVFANSNSDEDLKIQNLVNNSKDCQITSNEAQTQTLKMVEQRKLFDVDVNLEIKKSVNENILKQKNSFGISKPYRPLFPKPTSLITEKLMNANKDMEVKNAENESNKGLRLFSNVVSKSLKMDLDVHISGNEPNKDSESLNTNLNLQMKKLLNEPTKNLRDSLNSPAKSISKIQNPDSPLKFETEINEIGSEEITIGIKRSASSGHLSTPPKVHCRSNLAKAELPLKFCDLICDLIKEPLTDEVSRKAVRAKIKEKGKLSHKSRRWTLNGLISDGTANLKVDFSTQFMDSVMGYTALDFSLIKKKAKNDPKLGEQIRMNMRNAQHKLEQSDWLMQLELAQNKTPLVVSATELTEEQRIVFEKRLQILKPQYT